MTDPAVIPAELGPAPDRLDLRTRRMLEEPVLPLLLGMAWPNVLIMLAQASTGLIETWWVARLGTDALAGMALVFPAVFLIFGAPIYRALGGAGQALRAALLYSDVVLAGAVFIWLSNGLASVIRGTGNMLFPALVTWGGVLFLIPVSPALVFGIGAPLVALVATNIGAGQPERALRIALTGAAMAFCVTEGVGLAAAIWPAAWLGLFSPDPAIIAAGSACLRVAGPCYGFFGLSIALYFGSQGAARLFWPLTAGLIRLLIALGGGWLALWLTGSLTALFAALAVGLAVAGGTLLIAVRGGAWFRG